MVKRNKLERERRNRPARPAVESRPRIWHTEVLDCPQGNLREELP
jgi:hypothetical protein